MLWIFCAVLLSFAIYRALIRPFTYWKKKGVPQNSVSKVLMGQINGILQNYIVMDMFIEAYNKFPNDRYFGGYQFSKPLLFVRDPDLVKQITVKDFDHFVDHVQAFSEDTDVLWEKNLLSLKGEKWKDMRSTLSPSFTSSKMRLLFKLMNDCAKQFIHHFESQDQEIVNLEMKDAFTRFTNDVIASAAFGLDCNSLQDRENDFFVMGRGISTFGGFRKNCKFMTILLFPLLAKKLGLGFFSKEESAFFRRIIRENIAEREQKGIVRSDMIHLLLEARRNRANQKHVAEEERDGKDEGFSVVQEELVAAKTDQKRQKDQLSDDDITAQALIFFFAGFETVSQLMCFAAYELAVQPDIQDRLREEVDETLAECDGILTYEALIKMKYMDMVVTETLRKWPGLVVLDRVCVKPYTIQPTKENERPVHLKPGDAINIPIIGMHRDPELYPDPDKFDPERFSDVNKSKIGPYTYLPFGSGPRGCIGSRFALLEAKAVLFHILAKFDIVVIEKTPIPMKLIRRSFNMMAEGGFWLGLKKRRSN